MNKENIKAALLTPGWADIEQMMREEFGEEYSLTNIKTEGKSDRCIAREVESRQLAAKGLKRFISKLNRIKNDSGIEKKNDYI